jgi:rhodanese-related sulfurtransferase
MAIEKTEKPASVAVNHQLPKGKQTTPGLYVTAKEAFEKWKAAPDQAKLIDVRTPEEYAFIGHPEMAWNIPLAFVTYHRKDGKTEYQVKMNPDFVTEVKKLAEPSDTLLLMCRSGDRSAMAVNQLGAAGIKNAYTITDGMEGDKVVDPESAFDGKRMRTVGRIRDCPGSMALIRNGSYFRKAHLNRHNDRNNKVSTPFGDRQKAEKNEYKTLKGSEITGNIITTFVKSGS